MAEGVRRWQAAGPLDLDATLSPMRHGRGDPTMRWDGVSWWRATRTPLGPAAQRISADPTGWVTVRAWGPGATWLLEHAPALIGDDARPDALGSAPGAVGELKRRFAGLRFSRSAVPAEAMVPFVLEQKVTSLEAKRNWSRMVRAWGEPAPGPGGARGLRLPPEPTRLAAEPYWRYHRFGIEQKRADIVRRVGALASRIDIAANLPGEAARRHMEAVPGIGPWTSSLVAQTALGDLDAVVVGDYNIPHAFSWTVFGERAGTDERMLEWLAPFIPWRGLAQRLVLRGGSMPARRAPKAQLRELAWL